MHFRWWNSFNLLAIILLGIGITGAVEGRHMVFDPGRPTVGYEWVLYVIAGALMLVNGLLPPSHGGEEDDTPPARAPRTPRPGADPAAAAAAAATKTQE